VLVVTAVTALGGTLFPKVSIPIPQTSNQLSQAGVLLLLQLATIYLWQAYDWVADPRRQVNLGSIVALQVCYKPSQVIACLENWRKALECRWNNEDPVSGPAAKTVREVVRESLWRDVLGLIPVYFGTLLFGLWFAKAFCAWELDGLWWMIPLIAAATNYVEDICLFRYVTLHEKGETPNSSLTGFSFLLFIPKIVGFTAGALGTVIAIVVGTVKLPTPVGNWSSRIAILMTLAFLAVPVVYALGRIATWCWRKKGG
jgi:hypothetical protein